MLTVLEVPRSGALCGELGDTVPCVLPLLTTHTPLAHLPPTEQAAGRSEAGGEGLAGGAVRALEELLNDLRHAHAHAGPQ